MPGIAIVAAKFAVVAWFAHDAACYADQIRRGVKLSRADALGVGLMVATTLLTFGVL